MQTTEVLIFATPTTAKAFVGDDVAESFVAAIQPLFALEIERGYPMGEEVATLCFVWNGEGIPGLLAGEMTDEDAIFLLSDVLEETAGIWANLDVKIACYASPGVVNNGRIRWVGHLTVRQCLHAAEPA